MEQLSKFRPLTYFEVVTEQPYMVMFGKWEYKTHLMNCVNVVRFWELKDIITHQMETAAKRKHGEEGFTKSSLELVQGYIAMAQVLYTICDKPRFLITRIRHRIAFMRYCMKHSDFLWAVWDHVMSYNARSLQCNQLPEELQSSSNGSLEADGFYLQCEGFDPKNTNWRTVQLKHEHENYKAIAQFNDQQSAKRNKHGRQ